MTDPNLIIDFMHWNYYITDNSATSSISLGDDCFIKTLNLFAKQLKLRENE